MKINFKIIIKAAVICALLLLMLIPLAFVKGTVAGRLGYKNEAELKITKSWGEELYIAAPLLNVPYKEAVTSKADGKEQTSYRTAYYKYAPNLLETDVEIIPQVRYIGIFKVPVFTAKIKMKGYYAKPGNTAMVSPSAFITMEFNNLKGISSIPVLDWQGKKAEFETAIEGAALKTGPQGYDAGYDRDYYDYNITLKMLSAPTPSKNDRMDFDIAFEVRGSKNISFVPVAKDNKFKIRSSWASPNFIGSFLPDIREVTEKGFKAEWNVNSLSSGIPSYLNSYRGDLPTINVSFMLPVDNYRNSERAVKYGILFLALTFLACFVFEVVGKTPVHPFQYIMVGVALAVFYLLLVALSEFMGFALSYAIAAAATVALLTAYIRFGILKKPSRQTWLAAGGFTLLYVYLYVLLQLEDLSLIFGTLGLFAGLATVMYATRNINWYEEAK
jgi:inner membrane protein